MKSVFVLFFILLIGISCTKEKGEMCVAGQNGQATLTVFMKHEIHQIGNLKNYRDTVYVKYNALSSPGNSPSDYDATFIGDWPGDSVYIPNLSCGNYFLYEVGYNTVHTGRSTGSALVAVKDAYGSMNVKIEAQ